MDMNQTYSMFCCGYVSHSVSQR